MSKYYPHYYWAKDSNVMRFMVFEIEGKDPQCRGSIRPFGNGFVVNSLPQHFRYPVDTLKEARSLLQRDYERTSDEALMHIAQAEIE